jgi:cytoskeletal protein RodZ
VTVGETLTEARSQAGLSVDELSERTRIRGTVIRSIEEDDYDACGGDLYVRGYVRALAGAVGIDAQPLIREFDMGRVSHQDERADGAAAGQTLVFPAVPPPAVPPPAVPPAAVPRPGAALTAFDLPEVAEATAVSGGPEDLDATRSDLPVVSPDPSVTAYDLSPAPEDLMAAGYDLEPAPPAEEADSATTVMPALATDPAGPRDPAGPPVPGRPEPARPGRAGKKRRRGLLALAVVVVLAAAGGLGTYLVSGSTATRNTAATSVPSPAAASAAAKARAAKATAAAKARASAEASASAAAQARASASAKARQEAATKAAAQRVVSLPVASVTSFGPDGFVDGDNPGNAQYAVARDPAAPWESQWYATPDFGMLKHGTGLLLNLGGKVTVTSVRLDIAQYQGTNMQIRVGNGTALPDLRVAATASNVGGVVKLTLRHPVAAKYLLVWFTQLPPDGAGHYQETVAHVAVTGRR